MTLIPLVEHSRPRILMLDFPSRDVLKFQNAGFEAKRGATGLLDGGEYCLPYAVQDVEVIFAQVKNGSFSSYSKKSEGSIEEEPFFRNLLCETWGKAGWIVLFISQNTQPDELASVGLERLGVIPRERNHIPESIRECMYDFFKTHNRDEDDISLPQAEFPRFFGQDINIAEGLEANIIKRNIKSAHMSILSCLEYPHISCHDIQPHIYTFGKVDRYQWLITDVSLDKNVLALKLHKNIYRGQIDDKPVHDIGSILLLPDFEEKNCDIALALLQEVITNTSPHLFDIPQHSWLEKYLPISVTRLQNERETIISKTIKKVEQIKKQIEEENVRYAWLMGLLVSTGDQLQINVAETLRFLGFEVEEVDDNIAPRERKREDLRIWERNINYFALGEVKSTGKGRGAAEDFIGKTQTHQALYARENNQAPPPALLIVNFAIDLDPKLRAGRFYQKQVFGLLEDNCITAINTVALFELCQYVLNVQLTKEQVRSFLASGLPIINTITSEEVISQDFKRDH